LSWQLLFDTDRQLIEHSTVEPEDLTLWQERHLVSRWGIRILRECIEKGVSNTVYFAEYKRFLELKGGGYTPEQFVKYFGAMYLEACLFGGWLMARDLNDWGLRGVYEVDRQGNKRPITKGRVFDPSDIRKVEDKWQSGEHPRYAPQKLW
jgi:hypothetical protein